MVFSVSKGAVCAFNIQQPVCVGGITMVRAACVSKKKNLATLTCSSCIPKGTFAAMLNTPITRILQAAIRVSVVRAPEFHARSGLKRLGNNWDEMAHSPVCLSNRAVSNFHQSLPIASCFEASSKLLLAT